MSAKKQKPVLDKSFSLKRIEAKTPNQQETIDCYNDNYNLVLHGVAGTGKTFLSLWLAIQDVFARKYPKIIIVRSAVPSRDMGFLPGTDGEKAAAYEVPYEKICCELFGRGDAYQLLKEKKLLEFITTSHLRGTTLNDAIVIVDEIENMNFEELDTVITRMGDKCKVIFCGDIEQTDLYRSKYDKTGLPEFLDIIESCESFSFVEFGIEDIVRSGIVKEWIIAKRDFFKEKEGA
jgi:phosphate starvation-inducible protein PhoH